jgi:hypothetical protein
LQFVAPATAPKQENRDGSSRGTAVFVFAPDLSMFANVRSLINCVDAKVFLLDFNVGGLYRLTKRIERVVKFAAPLNRGEKVPP